MKIALIAIIKLIFLSISFAEVNPIVLEEGKELYEIGLNLEFLSDPTGKLNIEDVNSKEWANRFVRSNKKIPNFGIDKKILWIRFSVINKTGKKWYLNWNTFYHDEIKFFKKFDKKWIKSVTGDNYPLSSREIKARSFTFKIYPENKSKFFLRVENSGGGAEIDLTITTPEYKSIKEQEENFLFALFFGAILILTVYNFFIFLTTKSLAYLFYVGYSLSSTLFMMSYLGFSQIFLFINFPWIHNNGWGLLSGCFTLFLSLFAIFFLKIKESNPTIYKCLSFSSLTSLSVIIISFFFPYSFVVKAFNLNILLVSFVVLVAGAYKWKTNYRPAKYFLIAFLFVMIGAVYSILVSTFGVGEPSFISRNGVLIGTVIEMTLLSMGLADKYHFIQQKNVMLQENYSKNLEKQVADQTYKLELEKISIENMMEQIYDQKLARDQLLGNLSQGYLTFNKEGVIFEGATKITEELLQANLFESEIKKIKVWDILFKNQNKREVLKKWIDKIFEGKFSFRDLNQLAPKSFEGNKNKNIVLEFRPIYEEGSRRKINKVIMIASDKTHEVKLKKQLERDKESTEFINKCLQNPLEFVDLIFDSTTLIHEFNHKKNDDKGELFRNFHTLKARFGQFSLRSLTTSINNIETAISEEDFEEVKVSVRNFDLALKDFVKKNRLIVEAANKFLVDEGNAVQVSEIIEKAQNFEAIDQYIDFVKNEYLLSDIKIKFERYIPLANEIAERQGKSLDFKISGDKILVDTHRYSNFINSSIHLFRNMVDHGIESEDERVEKTKPQKGNINVSFKTNGNTFEIVLKDDGQGVDPDKIRGKALEKGLKSKEELSKIKNEEIIDMIFLPGLSTKEEVTEVSGRGVGMDAVRDEVEKLNGEISVKSKVDEGTTFTIKLPIIS